MELKLEKYCDECPHFEAKTNKTNMYSNDVVVYSVINIRCVNSDACRRAYNIGVKDHEERMKHDAAVKEKVMDPDILKSTADLYDLSLEKYSDGSYKFCTFKEVWGIAAYIKFDIRRYLDFEADKYGSFELYVVTELMSWVGRLEAAGYGKKVNK